MPESGLTPAADSEDAKALADWLGIEFRTIDIADIISAFMVAVPESESAEQALQRQPKSKGQDVSSLLPRKPDGPYGHGHR